MRKNIINIALFVMIIHLPSCALFGMLFTPNIEGEKKDRFLTATDHQLLKIYSKEEKLGYVYDNNIYVKKVWGGKKICQPTGQSIKLTYTQKDFDNLKVLLGDDLSLGPGLENIHHLELYLEDIHKCELIDIQPQIEYMGKEYTDLLRKPFIASMIKVTKMSIKAYQKVIGEFGAEYRPYPMIKLKGSTGTSSGREEEQVGYNVFVGYKTYDGSEWMQSFENMPKIDLWILRPEKNSIIKRDRVRITGSIVNYNKIEDDYKNRLRVYLMVRDEYFDNWILQSKTRVDNEGYFEGIVKLGTPESGDGHRYSIAAFATYFEINREVNSEIPDLPFNKGKYIINVTRKDDLD